MEAEIHLTRLFFHVLSFLKVALPPFIGDNISGKVLADALRNQHLLSCTYDPVTTDVWWSYC